MKPTFPLKFSADLSNSSKWTVRWHPKIAAKVKYAYRILSGSVNSNNPHYNPKLRTLLSHLNHCWVCQLTDQEWQHPQGIISSSNPKGKCSTKIADPQAPPFGPQALIAETFRSNRNQQEFDRFQEN
jgi:hypothetical protein